MIWAATIAFFLGVGDIIKPYTHHDPQEWVTVIELTAAFGFALVALRRK